MSELPASLRPDVKEWLGAHPELAAIIIQGHEEGWTATRLEEALRKSDWYKEARSFAESWGPLEYLRLAQ